MWKIEDIFDGAYGCEELQPGEKPKVSVRLINEKDEERYIYAEDEWLIQNGLDVGSVWIDK